MPLASSRAQRTSASTIQFTVLTVIIIVIAPTNQSCWGSDYVETDMLRHQVEVRIMVDELQTVLAQKVPMSTSMVFLTVTPFDLRSR